VFYLAHILDKKRDRIGESAGVLIPPFLLAGLGCLLVYAQNDFSTAVIVGLCAIAMFWAAGSPASFFLGLGAATMPLAALSVLTSDFRLKRILAFLFPAYEPHGQGYQVLGSIKAIRSGGFLGKGLGLGSLKRGSIPEVQSDFIFAAWTEEAGFFGALAVLCLFGFLAWRAFRIAFAEEDSYRSCLGMGMAFLLCLETLVNAAVVAGVVPATGMALPFFSAGGSSLLSTAISCGILYNLSVGSRVSGPAPAFSSGELGNA
jgi:cell division protein FtsW